MKLVSVVGARPQFVKAAPLSRCVRTRASELLVHTGQHYDDMMSRVFFDELGIPPADYHLGVGSGSHAAQTGAMLRALEPLLEREAPDLVLVYGDTNSTLAGALCATKLHIPVAHVEAGLRSFNRRMPEEVNRVLTDHVSELLFAPSDTASKHLAHEGITSGVHVVGDIMYDAVLQHSQRALAQSAYPGALGFSRAAYFAATVHRAENTDDPTRLRGILEGLQRLDRPVVLPVHPRTKGAIGRAGLVVGPNVRLIDPLGYLDMLALVSSAAAVLTDSGGLQKEAYYLGVPCVTLRDETEWCETVTTGWNVLVGTSPDAITSAIERQTSPLGARPELYGDGRTAERIAQVLHDFA